jgi:hypothetical protein
MRHGVSPTIAKKISGWSIPAILGAIFIGIFAWANPIISSCGYIDLTELTRLRVASAIWFVLVAIGLAYVIWRIMGRRDNRWLINVNALTALVILYPCCFVNFDGMIANFNAAHCSEAGGDGSRLDIEYFEELGPTSVAALDSVRDRITFAPKREQAQEISDRLHAQLDSELADWRGWTWRRQRTAEAAQNIALAKAKSNSENQVALAPADAAH